MTGTTVLQIGLGMHAQRVHYPVLEAHQAAGRIHLAAVVDCPAGASSVDSYLSERKVNPQEVLLVPETESGGDLPASVVETLDGLQQRHGINTVVVSTEPLAHQGYATWALSRGLHVLVDKPPTARPGLISDPAQARAMATDFSRLTDTHRAPGTVAGVLTQRRYHAGMRWVKQRIHDVQLKTGCPVTSIVVEHSDGEWRMPWEIANQRYHPFLQGYGMLLHSGYHAVDTALWLAGASAQDAPYDSAVVSSFMTLPSDLHDILGPRQLAELFPASALPPGWRDSFEATGSRNRFGELDCRMMICLKTGPATPAVISLNLLHNSFSQRAWAQSAGRNLYTGNGRCRQETYLIQQGPFQSIKVHSYKSGSGPAGWHATVFRNSSMFPEWQTTTEFELTEATDHLGPELAPSVRDAQVRASAGAAKYDLIGHFLDCVHDRRPESFASSLADHRVTTEIIAAAYESWSAQAGHGPVQIEVKPWRS